MIVLTKFDYLSYSYSSCTWWLDASGDHIHDLFAAMSHKYHNYNALCPCHSALYCQSSASHDSYSCELCASIAMTHVLLTVTLTNTGRIVLYDLCFNSSITVETSYIVRAIIHLSPHDLLAPVIRVSR